MNDSKYVRVIHVDEGNDLTVYGTLGAEEEGVLVKAFAGLGGFSFYRVAGEGGVFSAAVFNTAANSSALPQSFDHRLRPAITLLRLLSRKKPVQDEETSVHGLPDVELNTPLAQQAKENPEKVISINAETIRQTLEESEPCSGDEGAEKSSLKVFGPKTFSISVGEAYDLEQSGRIVCDTAVIPTAFYISLFKQTSTNMAYYSNSRTISLMEIGTPESNARFEALQHEAAKRSSELCEERLASRPDPITFDSPMYEYLFLVLTNPQRLWMSFRRSSHCSNSRRSLLLYPHRFWVLFYFTERTQNPASQHRQKIREYENWHWEYNRLLGKIPVWFEEQKKKPQTTPQHTPSPSPQERLIETSHI